MRHHSQHGWRVGLLVWLLAGAWLPSLAIASEALTLSAQGSIQLAFTPGDDAAGLIIQTLGKARKQVLVQTYSFTHRGIAEALVAARSRGLDVRVIADREQIERQQNSQIAWLAQHNIPVWVDAEHASAHNKVMVIDAGSPDATVITGSFNFTQAAQHRNAENLLVLRGNLNLAEAYAANWRRHRAHALALH